MENTRALNYYFLLHNADLKNRVVFIYSEKIEIIICVIDIFVIF